MGVARNWKDEEKDFLKEHWGSMPVPGLCKALNRTENAVIIMKNRLGLRSYLNAGEYITVAQLKKAITGSGFNTYQLKSWVEKRGFPLKYKRNNKHRWRIVYLDDFWEWAEKNKSFINFAKMEPLALGEEPSWVEEQRKKDYRTFSLQRKDKWESKDDDRLIFYLKQHKYSYTQLSEMLLRSEGAVQRRILDLGLKERPIKNKTHFWTENDYKILADGIRAGNSYADIGKLMGRSEKAIRGKVYWYYFTEDMDKVRSMLGSLVWGSGAPTPTVKQAMYISRVSTPVKDDISKLAGLLAWRRSTTHEGVDDE